MLGGPPHGGPFTMYNVGGNNVLNGAPKTTNLAKAYTNSKVWTHAPMQLKVARSYHGLISLWSASLIGTSTPVPSIFDQIPMIVCGGSANGNPSFNSASLDTCEIYKLPAN